MTKGRRLAIIVLFLTTALIGAGAIYIGNRLSNQPEITPDDAAAENWCGAPSYPHDFGNPCSPNSSTIVCGADGVATYCENGTWHLDSSLCCAQPTGTAGQLTCEVISPDGQAMLQIKVKNNASVDKSFGVSKCYCPDGDEPTCDQCEYSQEGLGPSGGGNDERTYTYNGPEQCGSWQLDIQSLENGGAECFAYYNSEEVCSAPTATPTPPSNPFDIQVLATCQDGSGPIYSVGGAQIIIGQGAGNSELTTVLNDNGAYTTTQYTTGPFVGHVRIGGAGTISLKERTNYPNGNVVRTVDISELTKITPVTGNSTGSAPQCNSSGNNAAGQCTCGGQYEVCNFHSDGANSSGRFFFEFKFSNCLGTTEVTPTATPVPGELSCGNVCVPGTSICAAGTVCSNVEGTYRCALQTCIDNPGSCADICSFEKLPQTALVSDKADRIILAMIMVLMGALVIRYGFSERLGDLFWSMGGKYILSKVHPAYARELKVETKKKMLSKQKKERRKFEKGF